VIVLDASALAEVVLGQPASAWVLDRIDGEEIRAPSHQPAELLSALARLVRDGGPAGKGKGASGTGPGSALPGPRSGASGRC
jgi:predicted nucleic acid-binding protein